MKVVVLKRNEREVWIGLRCDQCRRSYFDFAVFEWNSVGSECLHHWFEFSRRDMIRYGWTSKDRSALGESDEMHFCADCGCGRLGVFQQFNPGR
jgi:hypothetical protein